MYYCKQYKIEKKVDEFRAFDNPVAKLNEINEQIAKAKPLTDEETAKREELELYGFSDWKRFDFNAFIKACELFGRKNNNQ